MLFVHPVPPMVARQATFRLPLLAGAVLLSLAAVPGARAHGIESTLERLGSLSADAPLRLESKFSNGLPAREAAVRMVSPDGATALELGRTNADGRLTFPLPAQARADWELQVDAGPGHRDYVELPAAASAPLHGQRPASLVHPPLSRAGASLGAVALLGALAGLLLHRPRP